MDADEFIRRTLPVEGDPSYRGRQGEGLPLPSLGHETQEITGGHQGGSQNTQNLGGRIIPPKGGSGITKPSKGEGKK